MNPWRLFKTSEIILASNLAKKISETLARYTTIDLNSISDTEKNVLVILCDNLIPYEWRKMWQGPKTASDFLKSVSVRIQTVSRFLNDLDGSIDEIDFSKIFNVDSFLSTLKLVTSRDLKISTSDLVMESFTEDTKHQAQKYSKSKIIKVFPLIVDGLSIENNMLIASDHFSTSNMTGLIYIFFKEITKGAVDEDDQHMYSVPLYSTYTREKLLCTIKLNTRLDKTDVVYSGTALIVPSN